MLSRVCNKRSGRQTAALLLLSFVALGGCGRHQNNEGVRSLLGANTPGLVAAAGNVGYVDMDALVKAHPLHAQLDAMQQQILVLRQESVSVPSGMTASQNAAYNAMQRELDAAQQKFQKDLAQRRTFYEQREADAIAQLQAAAIGAQTGGGVLTGMQQQYGEQAKQLQKQAFSTLNSYRDALFKADADHLRHTQQLLAADVRTKARQRENELSTAETKYQIDLARQDQSARLNLQAKLQNLALSDKDRADYSAQLKKIDDGENVLVNRLKAQDNAALSSYVKGLQSQASAKFDAERKITQAATQVKLLARQREVQTAMGPQMQALGGKFQQQLADVNKKLASNTKYQAQAQNVHAQMQSNYVAEAKQVAASYHDARRALIGKYSTAAHMQFQDNEAIAAQMDKLAADRRDLLAKIVDQIRIVVQHVAQTEGVSVVFQSIRGAGTSVDLTQAVQKALAAQAAATTPASSAAPTPTSSGGS